MQNVTYMIYLLWHKINYLCGAYVGEKIIIIVPKISDDEVSSGLYKLSEILGRRNPAEQVHGFLGGEWGYSQKFENDVFMMNPFCWCDQGDCGWCSGSKPNFLHKKSGFSVKWYKYIGRDMEFEKPRGSNWKSILRECTESITKRKNK